MRKEFVIGICFVMAGVLCACLFGYDYFSTYGFLNEYHMQTFAKAEIDLPTLLANIVWKRGELFLLIWIIGYTPARRIAPLILRCVLYYTAGMFAGVCLINMGIFGLVVFLGSWIPHGLFYFLAIALIVHGVGGRNYGGGRGVGRLVIYAVSVCSLFVIGCVSEATVGTWILQRLFGCYRIPTV